MPLDLTDGRSFGNDDVPTKTQSKREFYGRRKWIVEPMFGIIKQVLGFRQFLMRGTLAVAGEWKLVAMAYIFKRMYAMATG